MNYAMPMIRYRIGDRGGRITKRRVNAGWLPLLDELSGRTIESLVNHRGEHHRRIRYIPVHLLGVMNECRDEVSKSYGSFRNRFQFSVDDQRGSSEPGRGE
jgi:hypothetical protein